MQHARWLLKLLVFLVYLLLRIVPFKVHVQCRPTRKKKRHYILENVLLKNKSCMVNKLQTRVD